jgi:hypothetical protein
MSIPPILIRRVIVHSGPHRYDRYQVSGWINQKRVRHCARTEEEAKGLKFRMEVEAAQTYREPKRFLTRLTQDELYSAEIAVSRLGSVPLTTAAEFYLANWRPPAAAKPLSEAVTAFLADRAPRVSGFVINGYRRQLSALCEAFPGMNVSEITGEALRAYMAALWKLPKTWNGRRGEFNCFFRWCRDEPQQWAASNVVASIPKFQTARGVPEILPVAKVAELFAYLESYSAPNKTAYRALIHYFSLATFGGLRPSSDGGEIFRLGRLKDLSRVIDLKVGVIRISPEIAKTKDCRSITIQPNLRAWLERYPLDRFPIIPTNARGQIQAVRQRLGLSHDVLRHSFISYHVAKFRSLGDTALQAGNSESVIKKHYLALAAPQEAEAFWAIVPKG